MAKGGFCQNCTMRMLKFFLFLSVVSVLFSVGVLLISSDHTVSVTTRNYMRYGNANRPVNVTPTDGFPSEYGFSTRSSTGSTAHTDSFTASTTASFKAKLPLCPVIPPGLRGRIKADRTIRDWTTLESMLANNLTKGGAWRPSHCISRHRVGIIIPYRDREDHLKMFVQNLHPFLQRQEIDYAIYVVELAEPTRFNRGMLRNIGYIEASKLHDYQCYVFHDVDLYPEDDRNLYTCPETPRLMNVASEKWKYKLVYKKYFGGVVAMKGEHFRLANGYSNKYFAWGGEDDDLYNRIRAKGLEVIQYPVSTARYAAPYHSHDKENPTRMRLLRKGQRLWATDGLNSLVYKVEKLEYRPLYTWIYVSFDEKEVMASVGNITNSIGKNSDKITSKLVKNGGKTNKIVYNNTVRAE